MGNEEMKYTENFAMASIKTTSQIRQTCERLESSYNPDFIIKHNGNHIWLEIAIEKRQFWSPLLHLEIENSGEQTFVKGQYIEHPILWVIFLAVRILSATVFFACTMAVYYNAFTGKTFGTELLLMFLMVNIWFALWLLSKWQRKKGEQQFAALHSLMKIIVS